MAPLILKQLFILLWKSWIIRKRHWISAIFEFIFPILVVSLLAWPQASGTSGRSTPKPDDRTSLEPPTYFEPKTLSTKQLFHSNVLIYYTPINDFTSKLMNKLLKNNPILQNVTALDNEDLLFAKLTTGDRFDSTGVGIVFLSEENDKNFNFKIRVRDFYLSKVAGLLFPNKFTPGPAYTSDGSSEVYESDIYERGGTFSFTKVQIAINEAYLDLISENNRRDTTVSMVTTHQIPYPPYLKTNTGGGVNAMSILGLIVVIGYIVIAPLIVKRITDEKVAKAKEMLRMMGMSDWVFWGSHFINFLTIMAVQSIFVTLILVYGFGGIPFIMWSNGLIFFIAIILYNITTILSCMLLTTVFNRPVIAVVVSVILFAVSLSVPTALLNPTFNGSKIPNQRLMALSCFLPNMGIQWVMTLIGNTELYGHGVTWNNLWDQSQLYKQFTLGYVMLLMFLSIFVYAFLIWYIDNVWPFQHGIPKPFYYPFQPSYWFPTSDKSENFEAKQLNGNPEYFEREPINTNIGIKCQNLKKVFSKKIAVNDVTLNIFSGQITVLLGHNGAGKTTTMNMITGIFPPSNGTALIDGYDIRRQTKKARRSMALCPQENILYNELNVYEHLKLYSVLKDHPFNDVEMEINKTLQMISLTDKRNSLSTELSGGMKRKLCLGIAMIANSEILVLDEPTSGMDPEARRHMWDVLQSIRNQRTILLTTHYMEEADALGDRIAIMNEGLVKCCGTPMFLKKTFGAGYHLRISKNNNFRKDRVLDIIRNYIPNADIKSEIHSEVIYTLESETQTSSAVLAQLFSDLESRKKELDINSCGLTVTTMEDVFLRVGNEYNDNELVPRDLRNNNNDSDQQRLFQSIPKNTGMALKVQQFQALFLKRFHHAKRYWPMMILQIILPSILFMCILLLDSFMKTQFKQTVVDRRTGLKSSYGNTEGFVSYGSEDLKLKYEIIYKDIANSEGVNTNFITENPDNWTMASGRGNDMSQFITTYLVGAQFNESNDGNLHLIPWYNKEASQTLPNSINILYETLLKKLRDQWSITVHNHPIPTDDSNTMISIVSLTLIISCLLLMPLTVPFIGASYVLFPIHERVSNSKLLQLMNGLSSSMFWRASYLFDILTHLLATIFIFIIFIIFDWNKVFWESGSSRTGLFFIFFLFGFASIPLAYLVSLRLKKPSSGYALLVILYLITGLVLVMGLGIFDMLNYGHLLMSESSFEAILFFARLLPVFSMSFGIQKIYKVGSYQKACLDTLPVYLNYTCHADYLRPQDTIWGCCANRCNSTFPCYSKMDALEWGPNGVAIEFVYLILTGLFYLFILALIEERIIQKVVSYLNPFKPKNPIRNEIMMNGVMNGVINSFNWNQEDSDVVEEKQRVNHLINNNGLNSEAIVVKDLSKSFQSINAVNCLSFSVHKEEVFGLLGVNGAGKTTTFKMLTGDEQVSDGNAWISSLSLRQDLRQFQKQIGYCPQFDALLDKMTGSETLFMFCRLRGMPEELISGYVSELVQMVDLTKHVNKRTETYSGGNRRKLSLAIALCAAPPVVFLDEPTSGVDPSARRKIWSTLAYLQEKYGSAFILTSHSMEECEALCSRLAIMVNGQFQCLGSVQHLRSKFGQGFTVVAKLKRELADQPNYLQDIQNYFRQQFPSAVLKDIHQCLLHYHITDTSILWSKMFGVMEEIKTKYFLEDYIISDTTLEQIFLAFARKQR